ALGIGERLQAVDVGDVQSCIRDSIAAGLNRVLNDALARVTRKALGRKPHAYNRGLVSQRVHPWRPPRGTYDAGRNFTSVTSGVTSSNCTCTGIPTCTSSGSHPTMLDRKRSPGWSSSSTSPAA